LVCFVLLRRDLDMRGPFWRGSVSGLAGGESWSTVCWAWAAYRWAAGSGGVSGSAPGLSTLRATVRGQGKS